MKRFRPFLKLCVVLLTFAPVVCAMQETMSSIQTSLNGRFLGKVLSSDGKLAAFTFRTYNSDVPFENIRLNDDKIFVFSCKTGQKLLGPVPGLSAQFSPNNRLVAVKTGLFSGTATTDVYSTKTGKLEWSAEGSPDKFSPDSKLLAVYRGWPAIFREVVTMHSTETGVPILAPFDGAAATFSRDGTLVAIANNVQVTVFRITTGEYIFGPVPIEHAIDGKPQHVAFDAKNRLILLSGSMEEVVA